MAIALVAAACTAESTSSTGEPSTTTTVTDTTAQSTTDTTVAATTTTVSESGESPPEPTPLDETNLRLEVVADGFEQPVFYTVTEGRRFVVDQPGVIWELSATGQRSAYLDLRDRVRFGGEQGLLGLAFHPEYESVLYVNYTGRDGRTVVSEFTEADPASERVILEVSQPARNHNGGMIAFGPAGNLWIGMGDGGAANDQFGNGQNEDTLLGAMLRIAVAPEIEGYETVGSGPFTAPESWAIGVRNPWRFSFDRDSIWIADVGQNDVEEINRDAIGSVAVNYGWPLYEGTECFAGPCTGVDADGRPLTEPVHEYRHDEGCSITGGYVYRGSAMPQLDGHYFFSDWCSGFIRSIAPDGSVYDWTEGTGSVESVTSFGRDDAGEIYVVSGAGTIYRLVDEGS